MEFNIGRISIVTLVLLLALLLYLDHRSDGREARRAAETINSGQMIAFQAYRDGNGEIYVIDVDGKNLTNITLHDSLDYHPVGSPDGRFMAWVSDRSGMRQVWMANRDGSEPRQVTDHEQPAIDPSFSPDGIQMVYDVADSTGNVDLWIVDVTTGEKQQLTTDPATDSHGFWSPDGSEVAFYSNRDIPESDSMDVYVRSVYGSAIRRLP